MTKNLYKFNDENGAHQHLLWSERKETYEQLTGVTSVVEVLGKTLTWWAVGLAVSKLGWIHPKPKIDGKYVVTPIEKRLMAASKFLDQLDGMSTAQYVELLDEAYKAHSVKLTDSAEEGTNLHAELERYVKWHMIFNGEKGGAEKDFDPTLWSDKVLRFAMWADKNVKRFLWSEGYCYDELLFVGGISDCGAEMKDGGYAIIDFKSAKEAYFNHFVQVALYDLLIEKHGVLKQNGDLFLKPEKKITKYIVVPFGATNFTASEYDNVQGLQRAAQSCITLYREKSAFENK